MSGRTFGTFALGFACGIVTLGVFVLVKHEPVTPATVQAEAHREMPEPLPAPPPGPPPTVSEAPGAAGAPAPFVGPRTPHDAAPRSTMPQRLHLAMPLAGVKPADLVDSFRDSRDGRQHEAIDIPAPRGTPVRAVAEGNVVKLFTSKQGGLTVYQFDNTQTYAFYYAHLDRYQPGLKEGMLLREGDVLGYVGTTGNAPKNVPHLHFGVFELGAEKKWWDGKAIDPLPLFK